MALRQPTSALFPYTTLFRSYYILVRGENVPDAPAAYALTAELVPFAIGAVTPARVGDNGQVTLTLHGAKFQPGADRKSTRLNSSHLGISYAVLCLKKTT